jgi:hypothetical protein
MSRNRTRKACCRATASAWGWIRVYSTVPLIPGYNRVEGSVAAVDGVISMVRVQQ